LMADRQQDWLWSEAGLSTLAEAFITAAPTAEADSVFTPTSRLQSAFSSIKLNTSNVP